MKRLLLVLVILLTSTISLNACANECTEVKDSLEKTHTLVVNEFNRAVKAYQNAAIYEGREGTNWKSVPFKTPNGDDAYLITDGPILDEYYAIKRVWLTIQVNNPNCFDARAVAEAQIQLEKY